MSNFMASQDARLSKFEADFKQKQSEMTNKIDTFLKAINNRMTGALPSDTVKNPKLNTSSVSSAHSYPMEDPQGSSPHALMYNAILDKYVESLELGKNWSWKLSKTRSLDYLSSPKFNFIPDLEDQFEKEEADTMGEPTMEEYMIKTRDGYGLGIAWPKIDEKAQFELKGLFLKELRDNTFSRLDHEDVNEHIEKVLEIVDLFHILNITQDQVMLRAFPMKLTGAASCWLRNEPPGSIITWEALKKKFLSNYCPPA
ncbi:hypothetical protein Tco_0085035 [Tanacetum coccineum]